MVLDAEAGLSNGAHHAEKTVPYAVKAKWVSSTFCMEETNPSRSGENSTAERTAAGDSRPKRTFPLMATLGRWLRM